MYDNDNITTTNTDTIQQVTEAECQRREADAFRRGEATANVEFDAWKERITEMAHEYADSNNLCQAFDDFMIEIGLRPRKRDFEVNLTVTFDLRITKTATSPDRASEAITDEDVADAVRSEMRYAMPSWDVEGVETA